jgi:hypothetical protein
MITTITPSSVDEISQIIERNSTKTINLRQELSSKYPFESGFLRVTNQFLNDLSFDFKTILQALDRFKSSNINLSNNLQDNLNKNNELNMKIQNLNNQIFSLETSLLNANHQIQDLSLLNKNNENYIEQLINKLKISKEKPYSKPNCCLCDCPFCQNNYSFNSYKNKYCPVENSYEYEMNSTGRSTLVVDTNKTNNNNNINNTNIPNIVNINNSNLNNINNNTNINSTNFSPENNSYQYNINNTNNSQKENNNINPSIQISSVPFSSNYNSNIVSNNNRNNLEPIPNMNIPKLIPQNNYDINSNENVKINEPKARDNNYNINNINTDKNMIQVDEIISSVPSSNIGLNINQISNDLLKSKNNPNLKNQNYNEMINQIPEREKNIEEKKIEMNLDDKINRVEKLVQNALNDENIIKYLSIRMGDDFIEKLKKGDVTEEYLNQIEQYIENYKEDEMLINNNKINSSNSLRKNYKIDSKFLPKRKFKDPKDNDDYNKMQLKKQITDPRYHFREYPRGWNSSKEYFDNNKSSSGKIEKNQIKIPNYPK